MTHRHTSQDLKIRRVLTLGTSVRFEGIPLQRAPRHGRICREAHLQGQRFAQGRVAAAAAGGAGLPPAASMPAAGFLVLPAGLGSQRRRLLLEELGPPGPRRCCCWAAAGSGFPACPSAHTCTAVFKGAGSRNQFGTVRLYQAREPPVALQRPCQTREVRKLLMSFWTESAHPDKSARTSPQWRRTHCGCSRSCWRPPLRAAAKGLHSPGPQRLLGLQPSTLAYGGSTDPKWQLKTLNPTSHSALRSAAVTLSTALVRVHFIHRHTCCGMSMRCGW